MNILTQCVRPNEAVLIVGKKPHIKIREGRIILPIIKNCQTISLEVHSTVFSAKGWTQDGHEVSFSGIALVRISDIPTRLLKACHFILDKRESEIITIARRKIESQVRSCLSRMLTPEVLKTENLTHKLRPIVSSDLLGMGLEVDDLFVEQVRLYPISDHIEVGGNGHKDSQKVLVTKSCSG